jgi:hypothetical protein
VKRENRRPHKATGSHKVSSTQNSLQLEGVPDVDDAINPFWVNDAVNALATLVESGAMVTADDVHRAVHGRPERPNAIGSVFATMHRAGLIARVGYCPSSRSGRNGSALGVWRKGGGR